MSKDYVEVCEELEDELGREPTEEEIQSRLEDIMCHAYDYVKSRMEDNANS